MKSKFNICIATPIYNGEKYIERLAKSIGQYPGATWLVRDDGSTDNTVDELRVQCEINKINLWIWEGNNEGLTYGRNFLSEKFANDEDFVQFTHMVFIDVDDYFNPGWKDTIEYWLNKVALLYPDEDGDPYLCFKYWNDRREQDECQIYTKLNTHYKAHAAVCQYPNGGVDLLHVIPRQYLYEVKEYDGNYYHVCKGEKWTPDCHNFMAYTQYPASFISDMVASLGENDGNMSDTYYDNVVTRYAKGQVDEMTMFLDIYGNDSHHLGFDWQRVPGFRWRWYLKCLIRMIRNGTLVFSGKKWDNFEAPKEVTDSRHP